jgi:acyl carrier protein
MPITAEQEHQAKTVIANVIGFKRSADDLDRDHNFYLDLGVDSIDIVELAMDMEEEFKIDIPDDKIETWKTVGDVLDYLDTAKTTPATSATVAA